MILPVFPIGFKNPGGGAPHAPSTSVLTPESGGVLSLTPPAFVFLFLNPSNRVWVSMCYGGAVWLRRMRSRIDRCMLSDGLKSVSCVVASGPG